jgi:hypothetical protein
VPVKILQGREDEDQLRDDLVALVREHGRMGHRKLTDYLRRTSRLVGQRQAGRAYLAAEGADGHTPVAETQPDLA